MSKLSCESSNSVLVSFMGGSILTNSILHLTFGEVHQNLFLGLSLLGGAIAGNWVYRQEKKKVR